MEGKPRFVSMMFTFADGSERPGLFIGGDAMQTFGDTPTPFPTEPVSWVPLIDWINERAAKPKPVDPPDDTRDIVMTFADGSKQTGFYSIFKYYVVYPENNIDGEGVKTDKRVVAWEYLKDWINDRL